MITKFWQRTNKVTGVVCWPAWEGPPWPWPRRGAGCSRPAAHSPHFPRQGAGVEPCSSPYPPGWRWPPGPSGSSAVSSDKHNCSPYVPFSRPIKKPLYRILWNFVHNWGTAVIWIGLATHVSDPHWFQAVLRIRDVYPGFRILIFTHPGSRIPDLGSRIKKQQQKREVKKN